jgi:hypothetical protein
MGGSGGSSFGSDSDVARLREMALARLAEQESNAKVNGELAELLKEFNNRDVALTRTRLEEIEEALSDVAVDVDRLLFGGSVAKHTYVDGLSDVDALIVVDAPNVQPNDLLQRFRRYLSSRLSTDVEEVSAGNLAVTIKYRDGSEIQVLPAVERNGRTSIASADGSTWRTIRPHKFAEKLTQVNGRNGGAVIPAIKLTKALLNSALPEAQRLGGYHVEAIAVDAFKAYNGRRDYASMLRALVRHAAVAVRRPTGDITGQSVHVDDYLGKANSSDRAALSAAIGRIADRLDGASASEVRRMLRDG